MKYLKKEERFQLLKSPEVTLNPHSATSNADNSKRLAKSDLSEKQLKILEPIYPETSTSENPTTLSSVTLIVVETATFSQQIKSNSSFDEISNYTTALNKLCQMKSKDLPCYFFEDSIHMGRYDFEDDNHYDPRSKNTKQHKQWR
ncbi:hypothetical protein HMI54_002840 [Coelomomyces lativittatus]|nr:hypothetical protein HMI54_002840 [Coelomomyces lativittatus]